MSREGIMKKSLILLALVAASLAPQVAHAKRYNLTMTFGQDILIAGKETDIAIRAQCLLNQGGLDQVRVYAVTANNAVLRSFDSYTGNGTYLTAVTPVVDSELFVVNATTGLEFFGSVIDSGYVLNLTTMHGFAYSLESTVAGTNSGVNDCILSMNLDAIKKFKVAQ
jgi:hypothetical protein